MAVSEGPRASTPLHLARLSSARIGTLGAVRRTDGNRESQQSVYRDDAVRGGGPGAGGPLAAAGCSGEAVFLLPQVR